MLSDNQTGNVYTQDSSLGPVATGGFAGIYRCSAPVVTTSPFVISFEIGGSGGYSLVVQEVYGLEPSAVLDVQSAASGNGTTADPGSVTPTQAYEYRVAAFGSDDPNTSSALTAPTGYAPDFEVFDGVLYKHQGLAATQISNSRAASDPTVGFDTSCNWAAAQATYHSVVKPQLLCLVNESATDPLILTNGGGGTDGKGFALPSVYTRNIPVAEQELVMWQKDAVILWFDSCSSGDWIVLAGPQQQWTLIGKTNGIIPAISGTTPGSYSTEVYWNNVAGTTLTDTGFSVVAYNASSSPIPSGTFVILTWEPSSQTWFATSLNPGGGGTSFSGARVQYDFNTNTITNTYYDTDGYASASGSGVTMSVSVKGYYAVGDWVTFAASAATPGNHQISITNTTAVTTVAIIYCPETYTDGDGNGSAYLSLRDPLQCWRCSSTECVKRDRLQFCAGYC